MAHKHKDSKSDCVSLDLFVGDEDDEPTTSSQNAVETLCLRILSKKGINYRFGGLQLHIKSPDFHVGKSFHVNLDENNRIDSIESYREPEDAYSFGRRRMSLLGSNNLGTSPARILISPKVNPLSNAMINKSSNGTTNNGANNGTSNSVTTNLINNTSVNKAINLPTLTADVVVEEIKQVQQDNKVNQEPINPTNSSLGSSLINTFLNKKSNSHSNNSSINNSPSQSIHSINSLSSSMLELRTTSPVNIQATSHEKLISKLTLQAYNHSEKESKYIKHKSKKYDFKKRSKEKLLKNGDKNETNTVLDKNRIDDKNLVKDADKKTDDKTNDKINDKNENKTLSDEIDVSKMASDLESIKKIETVQTKNIGVSTHLDVSCLSLNIQEGFFFNLRRTRSWKK